LKRIFSRKRVGFYVERGKLVLKEVARNALVPRNRRSIKAILVTSHLYKMAPIGGGGNCTLKIVRVNDEIDPLR